MNIKIQIRSFSYISAKNIHSTCFIFSMAVAEEYRSFYIANCILNGLLCCTATMLNSVSILAIRKTSSLPKTLKTLLLNLAVSDLGVGLLVQPLYIALLTMEKEQNAVNNSAHNSNFVYKTFLILGNLFSFASFFGVAALSADRFLAIHLHLRYQEHVTHKRVVAVVTVIWLFSVSLSFLRPWTPVNIIYVSFAIIYVACLITVAVLSYKIYMAVRKHQQDIQALQIQQLAQNVAMANVGRLRKSAITAIYVYVVFVLCYLSNTSILSTIAITGNSPPLLTIIQRYAITLLFLNSSLNPLIYSLKMRDIRHNTMNILRNVFMSQN